MGELLEGLMAVKLDLRKKDFSGFGIAKSIIESASDDDLKDCLIVLQQRMWECENARRHSAPMQLLAIILSVALATVGVNGLAESGSIIVISAFCVLIYVAVVIHIDLRVQKEMRPLRVLASMIEQELRI